jgi:hypothetical protein
VGFLRLTMPAASAQIVARYARPDVARAVPLHGERGPAAGGASRGGAAQGGAGIMLQSFLAMLPTPRAFPEPPKSLVETIMTAITDGGWEPQTTGKRPLDAPQAAASTGMHPDRARQRIA